MSGLVIKFVQSPPNVVPHSERCHVASMCLGRSCKYKSIKSTVTDARTLPQGCRLVQNLIESANAMLKEDPGL